MTSVSSVRSATAGLDVDLGRLGSIERRSRSSVGPVLPRSAMLANAAIGAPALDAATVEVHRRNETSITSATIRNVPTIDAIVIHIPIFIERSTVFPIDAPTFA